MEIFEKTVMDQIEIVKSLGVIQVRCIKQKWVRSGDQEMLVEPNVGLHRYSLNPGEWELADRLGVRSYADIEWTPDVIAAYQARLDLRHNTLRAKSEGSLP